MKNPGVGNDPTPGIWYYVWFAPIWRLAIPDVPSAHNHVDYWQDVITPLLADHYRLTPAQAKAVSQLHVSMPRGRVVEDVGKWYVAHGNDFPSEKNQEAEIKKLIGWFGLSRLAVLGRVEVGYSSHETMESSEKVAIQKIIGKVPY